MSEARIRHSARPGRFGARAVPACAMVAVLVVSSASPSAGAESAVLPDLVADPATNLIATTYTDSSGPRRLLRFDGFVHNRGDGALELRGSSPVSGEMSLVTQRVYDSGEGFQDLTRTPAPRILFEPADGHDHWHLRNAARYSLSNDGRSVDVAPSQKVGFCLIDSAQADPWARSSAFYTLAGNSFCREHDAGAESVFMGVSAGWRDVYQRELAFQWVDVSDVTPGNYALRSDADPDQVVEEADEVNPAAFTGAVVPGYTATPFTVQVAKLLPSTVTLRADKFGSPGSRQFRIDEAPKHGKLTKQAGGWFDESSLTYLPDLGYSGPDSFRFSARETNSPFPRNPRSATVSLGVGSAPAPVALGGAPSRLATGTGNQFTAASQGPLTWTVDGIPGGDATVGTISKEGWYIASPDAGRVTRIRATAESGHFEETAVRVVGAERARRAPDVPGSPPAPDDMAIAAPQVSLRHGDLIVRTVAWRPGSVRLAVAGGQYSSTCQSEVAPGTPFTCLLATGVSPGQLAGAIVVATLSANGLVLGSRETRIH